MSDGLNSFEINRLARQGQDDTDAIQKGIQRTARVPSEIRTVMNTGLGIVAGEGDTTILQIIKADGEQLHVVLNAGARRTVLRELQAAEDELRNEGGASSLELPG